MMMPGSTLCTRQDKGRWGLSNSDAGTAGSLDLLLGVAGEELGLDNDGDLGQRAVAEHLVVALDARDYVSTM